MLALQTFVRRLCLSCLVASAFTIGGAAAQQGGAPVVDWKPPSWKHEALVLSTERRTSLSAEDDRKFTRQQMPFLYFMVANSPGIGQENEALWGWLSFFRSCGGTKALFSDLQGEFGDKARGAAALKAVEAELDAWAATGAAKTIRLYVPLELGRWESGSQYFSVEDMGYVWPVNPGVDADFFHGNSLSLSGQIFGKHTGELTVERIATRLSLASCEADGGFFTSRLGQIWALYFGAFETKGGSVRIARDSEPKLPELKMSQAEAQAFVAKFPKRRIMVEMEVAADPDMYPQQINTDGGTVEKAKHGRLVRVRYLDAQGGVLAEQSYP